MSEKKSIGIKNIGLYIPEGLHTSKHIARESGIPEEVIIEKFAINQKHKADPDEHPSEMALKASRQALENFSPRKLDLVLFHGSEYKDYYLYNQAAKLQHELGAKNAYAFELHSLCSSGVLALKTARDMMQNDPDLDNVLLATSSKEADLLDYSNEDSRFMFNFGDAAAAVLLEKGLKKNTILRNHTITDGSFADDVAVYEIGSRYFNEPGQEKLELADCNLDVADIDSMRERLNAVTEDNFRAVIEKSLQKSGYSTSDIDFIALIHMKKSFLDSLLSTYDLGEEDSFKLNDYGHCQSADAFIATKKGVEQGKIEEGDLIVMVGAGTGYTWSATCVRWGSPR